MPARLVIAGAVALLIATPVAAFAGATLTDATPSADSVAQGAPSVVELDFSAPIEIGASHIGVKDTQGHRVDGNDLHLVGDNRHIAISLKTMLPGRYMVNWRVTSQDAVKTSGSYAFTIAQ